MLKMQMIQKCGLTNSSRRAARRSSRDACEVPGFASRRIPRRPMRTKISTGTVSMAITKKVLCQPKVFSSQRESGKPIAAPTGVPSSHSMVARACKCCGKL